MNMKNLLKIIQLNHILCNHIWGEVSKEKIFHVIFGLKDGKLVAAALLLEKINW